MTHTIVVGGGPAGLAAAYRLTRSPDQSVLLLERATVLGGLAAGFQHGDFTLDFGPHRLHAATDPTVLDDLRLLLGDELQLRPRSGRIRLDGRELPYPAGPGTLLALGPRQAARLGLGLAAARLSRSPAAPGSYESELARRLGRPFYDLFYGPYAEKVWGLPGSRIAADQAERRVNQRGIRDLVRLALGQGSGRHYYYPRGGFGRIPAAYAEALTATPSYAATLSANITKVRWDGPADRIRGVAVDVDGHNRDVPADHLVWTAPAQELVRRLDPPPPSAVRQAADGLRQRAVVLCYAVIATPRVGDADTYYFPELRFPFNRVTEQKNFSAAMAPTDHTVLCMDISCDPDDSVFLASDEELRALVEPALQEAGLLRRGPVVEMFSRRFPAAYPLYDLDYAACLHTLMDWLTPLENLWLVGRHGLFLHNNTHHSLLMGYHAADAIARASRQDWPARLAEFAGMRVAD